MEIERLRVGDHAQVATWLSDPSINRWLANRWQGRTLGPKHIGVLVASPATHLYLIRHEGVPAGLVALSEIDGASSSAGVWYLIDEAHRGKGLATTAVRRVVGTAFEELGMVSLNAWVTFGNEASKCVLERVGFQYVGVLRRGSLLDARHVDRLVFDILPEDFAKANNADREKDEER